MTEIYGSPLFVPADTALYGPATDSRVPGLQAVTLPLTDAVLSAAVSVTNSTTETDILAATYPGNTFTVGKRLRVRARGNLDTPAASVPTVRFRFRRGASTYLIQPPAVAGAISLTAMYWEFDMELVCSVAGASGILLGGARVNRPSAASNANMVVGDAPTGGVALDLTASSTFTLSMVMGTAVSGATVRALSASFERS